MAQQQRMKLQGLNAGQVALDTISQRQNQEAQAMEMQAYQKKQESMAAKQEADGLARQEAVGLLEGGNPTEVAKFMITNPEVAKDLVGAVEFGGDAEVSDRLNYAKSVASGQVAPREALEARIQQIELNGGNAEGLRKTLEGDDAGIIKAAENDWAVLDSKGFIETQDAMNYGEPKPVAPMTEYQEHLVKGSNADREVRKLEAENKVIENKIKQETNQVKLGNLKATELRNIEKAKLIDKKRVDATNIVIDSGQSTLDLISKIRRHPGFASAVGAKGLSSVYGALESPISGTDAAGATALIETLEAQNFLTSIEKFKAAGGAGSLSDAEGKKLGAALSSLSTAQNEKDFNESLDVIESLVGRQMTNAKRGLKKPEVETGSFTSSSGTKFTVKG